MTKPFKMLSKTANLMMRAACDPEMQGLSVIAYPYSANHQTLTMLVHRLAYLKLTSDGLVSATNLGRAYRAWSQQQPGA